MATNRIYEIDGVSWASLEAAMAHAYTNYAGGTGDLVTADNELTFRCGNIEDTVVLDQARVWTTDATRAITVEPLGGVRWRNGWSTNAYRHVGPADTSVAGRTPFKIDALYVEVRGIQVWNRSTGTGVTAIGVLVGRAANAAGRAVVDGCLIRLGNSSALNQTTHGISFPSTGSLTAIARNNVIYELSTHVNSRGISFGTVALGVGARILYNTIIGRGANGYGAYANVIFSGNIVQGFTNVLYFPKVGSTHNVGPDGWTGAGVGGGSSANALAGTVQFEGAATGDFRPAVGDTLARGTGVDLAGGIGDDQLTTDAHGDTRTVPWDRGALMAVAAAGSTIVVSTAAPLATATVGGANPGIMTINVTNAGTGTLNGLAVAEPVAIPWLNTILVDATAPTLLHLQFTTAGLAVGTYQGTLRLTSTTPGVTNSPLDLTVTFEVTDAPAPQIRVRDEGGSDIGTLALSLSAGQQPAPRTFAITNGGTGVLDALLAEPGPAGAVPWLAFELSADAAPAALTLTFDTAGLAPGAYETAVRLTSGADGVLNSPLDLPVTVTVLPLYPAELEPVVVPRRRSGRPHTGATLVLASSDPSVVRVEGRRLISVGPGTASITATARTAHRERTRAFPVTVLPALPSD
jgi:hypothetical protein